MRMIKLGTRVWLRALKTVQGTVVHRENRHTNFLDNFIEHYVYWIDWDIDLLNENGGWIQDNDIEEVEGTGGSYNRLKCR